MDDDERVLPRLDHLVQVADRACTHRGGERAVGPYCLAAADQVASGQVTGREIVVTGDGDEGPVQLMRHVLDEPRLAAAGRAFQHHGESLLVAGAKDLPLV